LLARLDQVSIADDCVNHWVAVQLIATVSAVIVQSGAVTLLAVTDVDHSLIQEALSNSVGFNKNC
jgi:hypothetical protein